MPLVMQAKLLRVLEERQVERVGGDRAIPVDVRVIVATHRNLDELVKKGAFRQDLYHRIYVYPLTLPPLRERVEDIPPLAAHFAAPGGRAERLEAETVDPGAIAELLRYPGRATCASCATWWSGCCCWPMARWTPRRPAWRCRDTADAPSAAGAPPSSRTLAERVDGFERDQILAELKRHNQRMTDTAKALGLERSHLYKKCQALGIDLRALRRVEP